MSKSNHKRPKIEPRETVHVSLAKSLIARINALALSDRRTQQSQLQILMEDAVAAEEKRREQVIAAKG
jgi:hypothetical protein